MHLRRVRPIIQVVDVDRTVAFYRDKLGFHVDNVMRNDDGHPFWAHLTRDEVRLMVAHGHDHADDGSDIPLDHSHGHRDVILYLDVDDVAAVRQDLVARGAAPSEPEVTFYDMKEICLADPDGFAVILAEDVAKPQ